MNSLKLHHIHYMKPKRCSYVKQSCFIHIYKYSRARFFKSNSNIKICETENYAYPRFGKAPEDIWTTYRGEMRAVMLAILIWMRIHGFPWSSEQKNLDAPYTYIKRYAVTDFRICLSRKSFFTHAELFGCNHVSFAKVRSQNSTRRRECGFCFARTCMYTCVSFAWCDAWMCKQYVGLTCCIDRYCEKWHHMQNHTDL